MNISILFTLLLSHFSASAAPGDLVSVTHLDDASTRYIQYARGKSCPNLYGYEKVFGFKRYKVTYKTTDHYHREYTTAGLMILPDTDKPTALYVYQHGTLFARAELPSSNPSYQEGDAMGYCFSSIGYISLLPDYLGFGDGSGVHPYLHAESQAKAGRDMMRAAKTALANMNIAPVDRTFIAGYSQGGHAAMALLRLLENDPNQEFTVTAAAPMAGPYSLTTTIRDVLKKPTRHSSAEAAYIVMGLNPIYYFYGDLKEVIRDEYVDMVSTMFDGTRNWSYVLKSFPMTPENLIQPQFLESILNETNFLFLDALKQNEVYQWVPRTPVRFYHGKGDHEVPYSNSEEAFYYMGIRGARVELVNLGDDIDHAAGAILAFGQAALWFETFVD